MRELYHGKEVVRYPPLRIGILGGGQLAKMMAQAARKLSFSITILDPSSKCPASQVADHTIVGNFYDEEKIKQLVSECDVTTYDIEHINTGVLKELVNNGCKIFPSPELLDIIQDKYKQKKTLEEYGISVPKFNFCKIGDIFEEVGKFGFPVVQKSCKDGYDGRGVFVIKNKEDIGNSIKTDSILEEYIDIDKELGVMVARSINGEIKCHPVVEMLFDKKANICSSIIAPANLDDETNEKAEQMAIECVRKLNGVGIFGVELFLDKNGKIFVNEIAPRPHNSGHYTIEACKTSQFEQHIRAITGLPLGSTDLLSPAVMMNILGEEGYEGPVFLDGVYDALSIEGISLHFYGKEITKPFRKMGHITVLDKNLEIARAKAEKARNCLRSITNGVK